MPRNLLCLLVKKKKKIFDIHYKSKITNVPFSARITATVFASEIDTK